MTGFSPQFVGILQNFLATDFGHVCLPPFLLAESGVGAISRPCPRRSSRREKECTQCNARRNQWRMTAHYRHAPQCCACNCGDAWHRFTPANNEQRTDKAAQEFINRHLRLIAHSHHETKTLEKKCLVSTTWTLGASTRLRHVPLARRGQRASIMGQCLLAKA